MSEAFLPRSWRLRAVDGLVLGMLLLAHWVFLWLMLTRRGDPLFNDAMHRLGPGTDLATYLEAGRFWRENGEIYNVGTAFGFRYHPLFAMTVGAGLSFLEPRSAHAVWVAANELVLLLSLCALRPLVGDRRRFWMLSAVFLLFSPYLLDVYMGNASFLAAGLLILAFASEGRGRSVPFVVLFTLSILVKPIGLALLPVLLIRGRYRETLVIAGAVAGLALPYFLGHPEDWRQFLLVNTNGQERCGWTIHAGAQGLMGLISTVGARWSGRGTAICRIDELPRLFREATLIVPAVTAAVALAVSFRARDRVGIGVFLWSCVYLLGFVDVWEHSYAFLLLGLGLLFAERALSPWIWGVGSVGLALPTAFALYDVPLPAGPIDPEHYWNLATSLLHHSTKVLFLLVLFGMSVVAVLRSSEAASAKPRGPGMGP